jgi:hypothetical protein
MNRRITKAAAYLDAPSFFGMVQPKASPILSTSIFFFETKTVPF